MNFEIIPFYGIDIVNRNKHHNDILSEFPDCEDFMKSTFSKYVTSSILNGRFIFTTLS